MKQFFLTIFVKEMEQNCSYCNIHTMYSQTYIKRSLLGQRKSGLI